MSVIQQNIAFLNPRNICIRVTNVTKVILHRSLCLFVCHFDVIGNLYYSIKIWLTGRKSKGVYKP